MTSFIQLKQRGLERTDLLEHAARMEAEIFQSTQQVAETSRQPKEANAQLAQLYEKTRELDQLKSQFFANVSHELRTPLALILGPVEKRLAAPDLPGELREELELIARNARALLRQVNDLLDASKLEAGKLALAYVEVDAAELLRRVAGQFSALARERSLTLRIDAPGPLRAQVDAEKLQRVLLNLISNALKFTQPGGTVRCSARYAQPAARAASVQAAGGDAAALQAPDLQPALLPSAELQGGAAQPAELLLEVADSGQGIPLEQRERVFERFHQLDGSVRRRFGGTGLGLAIARELVELHGGTIEVDSAPEGGALFSLRLPALAPATVEVRQPGGETARAREDVQLALAELRGQPPLEAAPALGAELARPLVLVVEDNPDVNRFICRALSPQFGVLPARWMAATAWPKPSRSGRI